MSTNRVPSFWRWLWKESGDDRPGWHAGFAILLGLVTFAISIPLWYWLVGEFSGDVLPRPLDPIAGISFGAPGAIMAMVTAGICRPDDLRFWLLTGFMGLISAAATQLGMAAALTVAFNAMAVKSFGLYALSFGLMFVFWLPALGVFLGTSYFLGWRRAMRNKEAPPPTF